MMTYQEQGAVKANVSITWAVYFEPSAPNTPIYLSAEEYSKTEHKGLSLFCACCWDQKQALVALKKPNKGFFQTIKQRYVDEFARAVVDSAMRVWVDPRYALKSGEKHVCDSGPRYEGKRHYIARDFPSAAQGAVKQEFNLNIPCGQPIYARSKKKRSKKKERAAPVSGKARAGDSSMGVEVDRVLRRQLSSGIKNMEELAALLHETEYSLQAREGIALNIGSHSVRLSELFQERPADMFRRLHALAKYEKQRGLLPNLFHASAFIFQPQALKSRFWKKKEGITSLVFGRQDQVVSKSGKRNYYPQVRVRFDNDRVANNFERAFDCARTAGMPSPSFLIYSERSRVDLREFSKKKDAIRAEKAEDNGVYVDAHVSDVDQYVLWQPVARQQELALL